MVHVDPNTILLGILILAPQVLSSLKSVTSLSDRSSHKHKEIVLDLLGPVKDEQVRLKERLGALERDRREGNGKIWVELRRVEKESRIGDEKLRDYLERISVMEEQIKQIDNMLKNLDTFIREHK